MGEKETGTTADEARKSGTLNVSATPGGSVTASLAGKATAGGPLGEGPGGAAPDELNAINVKLA